MKSTLKLKAAAVALAVAGAFGAVQEAVAQSGEIFVPVLAIVLAGNDTTDARQAEVKTLGQELLPWPKLYVAHIETNRATRRFAPEALTQTRLLELVSLLTL